MTQFSKPIDPTPTALKQKTSPNNLTRWRDSLVELTALSGQRLLFGLLVLLSLIYLTYFGLTMARGTTFAAALPAAFTNSRLYLTDLLRGDLGMTAAGTITGNPSPIVDTLPDLVLKSFGLLAVSLLAATAVGVLLGLLANRYRRSNWSVAIIAASIVGISVPSFFAAPMLQLLMVQWTKFFGEPLLPLGGFGWDKRIILPALVLAARPIAQITRVTFVALNEVTEQDFIRVALSKGLRQYVVLARHTLPNIAIPVLTTVGLSLRFSLSSLPVVEYFFGWPGIGFTLLKSIAQRDDKLTVILILCLGGLLILVNLLLEMIYHRIDPRLRERSAAAGRGGRKLPLPTRVKDFFSNVREILADNPVQRRLRRQQAAAPPPTLRAAGSGHQPETDWRKIRAERRRAVLRATLFNVPFVVGGLIVLGLVVVILFGPNFAPHSPFTTHGLVIENGQMRVPPFAPDAEYPWGTDVLGRDLKSLIVAGAQQTLLLAAVVVAARLVIGATLGLLAGWWRGSWLDRTLMALAEILASFPTLLLAMTLILALGIRQGLRPFIIALCFVGWGEVMQFVRGQVMGLRPRLFIESAVAVGLRTPRIIIGHILPNLLPALISIAALEMGAVLILLGELGFIGIFIGGGSLAEVNGVGVYHYSDVPEWGALLSNLRLYARAYVWTAIYPTGAFFVAILGFNLFGEGMRRLVDDVGVHITNVVNRYTVGVAALALVGFGWAQQNTGLLVYYRQQAETFSGQQAQAYVERLAAPEFEGRALGSDGLAQATDFLVREFEALGLQPAGQKTTFLYPRSRSFEQLSAVSRLSLNDGGPAPVYLEDFSTFPTLIRNLGQASGRVRFLSTGGLNTVFTFGGTLPLALRGLDFSDEIVMVFSAQDAAYLTQVPHAGLLVITDDPQELQRNRTLYTRDPTFSVYGTNRETGGDRPKLWISEAVANRLLAGTGFNVARLRRLSDTLLEDQLIDLPTPNTATMQVDGEVIDKTATAHVLGYIPGTAGLSERFGQLNSQMIIVTAQYDSPPLNPDGQFRPAANDNASGVAVLLEAIRTMQESGYQPYRSFLFVAYSAEGMEGGELVLSPDPAKLLQAKNSFVNTMEVEAMIHVRGLGAGSGDGLALATSGSQRLANLFESAAGQSGVSSTRIDEPVNLNLIFENAARGSGQDAPQIGLSWDGWQDTAGTPQDTAAAVSADKLEKAGRTLSLALMIMGREQEY